MLSSCRLHGLVGDRGGPGEHPTFEDEEALESVSAKGGGGELRSRAGPAHEDDVPVRGDRVPGGCVGGQGGHRDVHGAGDSSPGELVVLAHVDDEGSVLPVETRGELVGRDEGSGRRLHLGDRCSSATARARRRALLGAL